MHLYNTFTTLFCPKPNIIENDNSSLLDFYQAYFYSTFFLVSLNIVNFSVKHLYKLWLNNELVYKNSSTITIETDTYTDTDTDTENENENNKKENFTI